MRRLSAGFVAAIAGVALTIFAWYGPWEWPAWPAFAVQHVVFGKAGADYTELPFAGRAAVLVGLIVVNVATWAALILLIVRMLRFRRAGL